MSSPFTLNYIIIPYYFDFTFISSSPFISPGCRCSAEARCQKEGHREATGEREGSPRHVPNIARRQQQILRLPHKSVQEEDQTVKEEGARRRWYVFRCLLNQDV